MAEIVNLRLARKARTRREKEQRASENRALFGQTKAQRMQNGKEVSTLQQHIDAHRRELNE